MNRPYLTLERFWASGFSGHLLSTLFEFWLMIPHFKDSKKNSRKYLMIRSPRLRPFFLGFKMAALVVALKLLVTIKRASTQKHDTFCFQRLLISLFCASACRSDQKYVPSVQGKSLLQLPSIEHRSILWLPLVVGPKQNWCEATHFEEKDSLSLLDLWFLSEMSLPLPSRTSNWIWTSYRSRLKLNSWGAEISCDRESWSRTDQISQGKEGESQQFAGWPRR